MIPNELIGIQVWCIARQEVQLDGSYFLFNELGHEFCDVSGVAIHNQYDRLASTAQKEAEKLYEACRIETSRKDVVPEGTSRIDGRNGIDGLALPARRYYGRLSLG